MGFHKSRHMIKPAVRGILDFPDQFTPFIVKIFNVFCFGFLFFGFAGGFPGISEVNRRDIFSSRDLGKVPAKGSVYLQKIDQGSTFIDAIQYKKNTVFECALWKGVPQTGMGFSYCSRFMRIEKNQHQFRHPCKITYDFLVIIAPVPFGDAVVHAGRIYDGKIFQKR